LKRDNIKFFIASAVAAVVLSGCGSSDSTVTTEGDIPTGTGYYLDSAVAGASYHCGGQSGLTGRKGDFTFEEGADCTFELAGIKLRTIKAEELKDEIKVVEDTPEVAAFLQSIDLDGDPSNGITIDPKVLEVLETLIKDGVITTTAVPTDDKLQTTVASIQTEIPEYKGRVVTPEDAISHVKGTLTEVTKELLAGKTLYFPHLVEKKEDGTVGKVAILKGTFDEDVSSIVFENLDTGEKSTEKIKVDGDKIIFEEDKDGSYTIISEADGYIYFDDRYQDGSKDGIGHRGYEKLEDAQAYAKEIIEELADETKALVGKTLYERGCNGEIFTLEIKEGGDLVFTDANGEEETIGYKIDGNKIYTTEEDGKKLHILIEKTDTYVKFYEAGEENDETTTFYFTKDAAENATEPSGSYCEDEGGYYPSDKFEADKLVGKTFYWVVFDDFGYEDVGEKWNMARFSFESESSLKFQEYDTSDSEEHSFSYSIIDGKLTFDETNYFEIVSSTDDYLLIKDSDGEESYFFFDEEKAREFRDSQND
jgi:hypothetical protein